MLCWQKYRLNYSCVHATNTFRLLIYIFIIYAYMESTYSRYDLHMESSPKIRWVRCTPQWKDSIGYRVCFHLFWQIFFSKILFLQANLISLQLKKKNTVSATEWMGRLFEFRKTIVHIIFFFLDSHQWQKIRMLQMLSFIQQRHISYSHFFRGQKSSLTLWQSIWKIYGGIKRVSVLRIVDK